MIEANDRSKLIEGTGAFMSSPSTVRLAGGIELPEREFESEASKFILLRAGDEKAAALAVDTHVKKHRVLALR